MRIVVISDTHSLHQHVDIPSGDVLIHAGDLTRTGTSEEISEFNDWLGTLNFSHIVVIAGNHDFYFQHNKERAKELLSHAVYLEDQSLLINGVRFYGTPWQPEFYKWAFNLPRGEKLKEKWDQIPSNIDVLITHTPPYGYRDQIYNGDRVGCRELTLALDRIRPALSVFGHIHENYGVATLNDTLCVNACVLSCNYEVNNRPIVVDLVKDETGAWQTELVHEVIPVEVMQESVTPLGQLTR